MFELEKLPFAFNDFDKLSPKSFEIHYLKHHALYVKNLNNLLAERKIEGDLDQVMLQSFNKRHKDPVFKAIFNNASQHWNHTFFWHSLDPFPFHKFQALDDLIVKSFGNIDAFKKLFIETGLKQFGSGWVWVVYNHQEEILEIMSTSNAKNPVVLGRCPILVCDVWEHAYYVDFLNNRSEFLSVMFDYFNWNFALQNLNYYKDLADRQAI